MTLKDLIAGDIDRLYLNVDEHATTVTVTPKGSPPIIGVIAIVNERERGDLRAQDGTRVNRVIDVEMKSSDVPGFDEESTITFNGDVFKVDLVNSIIEGWITCMAIFRRRKELHKPGLKAES